MITRFLFLCIILIVASCTPKNGQVVSQNYIHKYGFPLSQKEWKEREEEGKIVSLLDNGITITQSYSNGRLHGATTYSYPHSVLIEQSWLYDEGELLKITQYDKNGIPFREELFEFDGRKTVSHWDLNGVPMSFEEYEEEFLLQGNYFNASYELESVVENGNGIRTKRARDGTLLLKDQIENGTLVLRTTFHPNGEIQTVTNYENFTPQGEMVEYTFEGKLHQITNWSNGVLDGKKIFYRNGIKVREVNYKLGKKDGYEKEFNPEGEVVSEVEYREDKKHGPSFYKTSTKTINQWYYNDSLVSEKKFSLLESRDNMLEELENQFE